MTPVRWPAAVVDEMRRHARATYPDECCGFLLGPPTGDGAKGSRDVIAVVPAANEFGGERRRRFLIRPEELRAAEARAEARGLAVRGFYHSHPDNPATPSQFDQEHAWPWYLYVVLSVTATDVPAVGAFELDPEATAFRAVPWEATASPVTRA
jgi:proteasome lid subunit RPN8/RPN11